MEALILSAFLDAPTSIGLFYLILYISIPYIDCVSEKTIISPYRAWTGFVFFSLSFALIPFSRVAPQVLRRFCAHSFFFFFIKSPPPTRRRASRFVAAVIITAFAYFLFHRFWTHRVDSSKGPDREEASTTMLKHAHRAKCADALSIASGASSVSHEPMSSRCSSVSSLNISNPVVSAVSYGFFFFFTFFRIFPARSDERNACTDETREKRVTWTSARLTKKIKNAVLTVRGL